MNHHNSTENFGQDFMRHLNLHRRRQDLREGKESTDFNRRRIMWQMDIAENAGFLTGANVYD
jgi:hypothetical protein